MRCLVAAAMLLTASVAAESQDYIPDRYIVTLQTGVSPELFGSLVNVHNDATVIHTYTSAVRGFSGEFSDDVANALDHHPFVHDHDPLYSDPKPRDLLPSRDRLTPSKMCRCFANVD